MEITIFATGYPGVRAAGPAVTRSARKGGRTTYGHAEARANNSDRLTN